MSNPAYKEGDVIVIFKENVTEEQAKQLIESFGLTIEGTWKERIKMFLVKTPVGEEIKWTARFNEKNDIVEIANLNYTKIIQIT